MHQFPLLLQQNKHYHQVLQEPNVAQKSATPTTFSQNHQIDVEGDPLLLLYLLNHHHSSIYHCLLNAIYLRVNL